MSEEEEEGLVMGLIAAVSAAVAGTLGERWCGGEGWEKACGGSQLENLRTGSYIHSENAS